MSSYVLLHLLPTTAQVEAINTRNDPDGLGHVMAQVMLGGDCDQAVSRGLYRPVAALKAPDMDTVYRDSNHIDEDWTTNPSVLAADRPARSTSVGDIAFHLDSGFAWVCSTLGWKPLEAEAIRVLRRDVDAFLARHPIA